MTDKNKKQKLKNEIMEDVKELIETKIDSLNLGADGESWRDYQKLVLHELKDHGKELKVMNSNLGKVEVKVGKLEVRAGIWGALAGGVSGIIFVVIRLFT